MKYRKYISLLLSVSAMFIISIMSLPTLAEGTGTSETQITDEMQEFFDDYLASENFEELFKCEVEYKVYNKDNQLIRFGSLEDCRIKCLESRCDFLTEIDGTKFYKLNK